MKHKILSWLLILCLTFSLLGFAAAESVAPPEALPGVGGSVHGFTVIESGSFDLLGVPATLLEHDQTGALVYCIQSSDVNRAFSITFRTPALDNTGAPHVFEHITISGSDKYPSSSLFFPLLNQTYNTFINAMTGNCFTIYPMASLSEEQLFKLADVYLDGVFHPMLYRDERLRRREAWRYELPDAESPLTLTGTVYNEMKGARTIDRVAYLNLQNALYPGSIVGNDAGGDPAYIPDLTYEQLLSFHDAYYHPSNAFVVLYGDLDFTRFLEMLDASYFSQYDRKDVAIETGAIPPQDGLAIASRPFPVETNANTADGSYVQYGFVANGATKEDAFGLNVLASILSHESSPLVNAVREALPNAAFAAYVDSSTPEPIIVFEVSGVNSEDAEAFQTVLDGALRRIMQEGLSQETAEAILASTKFSVLVMAETPNLGPQVAISLGSLWGMDGNYNYYNDYLAALDGLQALTDTAYYTDLLDAYVLQNAHSALVCTYPEAGLAEEQEQALADRLATYKASLNAEEIQGLVHATAEMQAFSEEEAPPEILKSLQAVTVDTLPEEIERYEVTDEVIDGVRRVTAPVQVGQIGYTSLVLDTASIPAEDLHYLSLYTSLLGMLDTASHTREELSTLNTRYLNGLSVGAGMQERLGMTYAPVLGASWLGLTEDYETAVKLTREILFETKFEDVAVIQSQIAAMLNSARQMAAMAPFQYQIHRASAAFRAEGVYANYLSGIDSYRALAAMSGLMQTDPAQVTAKLEAIQQALYSKDNAMALFVGNEEGLASFDTHIGLFFDGMPSEARDAADYSGLPVPGLREALEVDSAVQYNLIYAPLETLGVENSGSLAPLNQILYDAYLTPKIRYGLGAYDSITMLNRDGILLCSYRDPSIAETFAVYEGLPEFLRNVALSQEDLDRYIISAYSAYALPTGKLNGASSAISLYLAGRSQDEKLARMQEMKAFTIDTLREMIPAFEALLEKGVRSTAGGAAAIEAQRELYDVVLRLDP